MQITADHILSVLIKKDLELTQIIEEVQRLNAKVTELEKKPDSIDKKELKKGEKPL